MKGLLIETLGTRILLVFGADYGKTKALPKTAESDIVFYMSDTSGELCEGYTRELVYGDRDKLLRALWVYLFCIRGFPYGEYDFIINGIKNTLTYDAGSNKQFGENVGKCKLLLSNSTKYTGIGAIEFYELLLGKYYFRIYKCQSNDSVDIDSLGSCICRTQTRSEPPRSMLAISPVGTDTLQLREYRFGKGETSPDSLALGAAAGFAIANGSFKAPLKITGGWGQAIADMKEDGNIIIVSEGFSYHTLTL